jgi:hypothetical protein
MFPAALSTLQFPVLATCVNDWSFVELVAVTDGTDLWTGIQTLEPACSCERDKPDSNFNCSAEQSTPFLEFVFLEDVATPFPEVRAPVNKMRFVAVNEPVEFAIKIGHLDCEFGSDSPNVSKSPK